jgi:hypothetical protein
MRCRRIFVATLVVAIDRNDLATTARLLDKLEASMEPEELADLLEAILGEAPAARVIAAPLRVV